MKRNMNRRNWNKGIALLLLLFCVVGIWPTRMAEAASATITIGTEKEEIRVGDTVEMQLTLRADATIGDFEAVISYDDAILEFHSAVSCITGGEGYLKVSDIGASPSEQDRTYRIYFKAIAQGECEVALKDRPVVYGYSDGVEMSVTGVSKTVTVLPAVYASDDCSLSALYLVDNLTRTVSLTPAFSSGTKEYYAAVPYEAEMLIVSALASHGKANVEVAGGKDLSVGSNEVSVTVTAEDGTCSVYTVHVYRSEIPSVQQGEAATQPEFMYPENGIRFAVSERGTLVTEYHTYMVCERPEDMVIPDDYAETVLLLNDIQVKAFAKQGAEEFLILVLENEAGEVNWYRYDRIEQTLQRISDEEFVITQVVEQNDAGLLEAIGQYEMYQTGLYIAVAFLFAICFVLLMVILWLCIRRKNRG